MVRLRSPARLAEMLRLIDSKYINGKVTSPTTHTPHYIHPPIHPSITSHRVRVREQIAKDLLPVLLSEWDDASVRALVDERGMQSINDPHTITQMAVDIINNNPTQLQQYRSLSQPVTHTHATRAVDRVVRAMCVVVCRGGKSRLEGFFVGQLMKQSGNRADPTLSQEIMSGLLNAPSDTDTEPAEREAVGLGQKES